MRNVISAFELDQGIREHGWLAVDCRFALSDVSQGARDYGLGHIPGAVYADLNRDLSDLSKTTQGRHPLPDDADFAALLERWGWAPDVPVVAYDAAGGALAASRLWWMLRAFGARDVAVLDGGLPAWTDAGFAMSQDLPQRETTSVSGKFDLRRMVDSPTLQALLPSPGLCLIDARAANRYRGDVEPLDPVAGHVPGACNRPFSENLRDNGHFKPVDQLRREFASLLGTHAATEAVHMCGSGVTACHNLLAMEHAGFSGSRLYAPSWSGWIVDPSRPTATGSG